MCSDTSKIGISFCMRRRKNDTRESLNIKLSHYTDVFHGTEYQPGMSTHMASPKISRVLRM